MPRLGIRSTMWSSGCVLYKMNGEDGRAEVTENQTLTIDPNAYLMQVQGAKIEEARFGIDIQDPIAGAVFERIRAIQSGK